MRDVFVEIWESIRRNKLRTCLTGFAVAWGIFMLIVLLGAGNGIMNTTVDNMAGINSNTMRVYGNTTSKPYGGFKKGRLIELNERDMALTGSPAFADHVDDISAVLSQSGFKMTYGKRYFDVGLTGVYPDYARMNRIEMLAGRFVNPSDIDARKKVLVITHLHARNFLGGKENYEALIGQRVKIGNISFKIVGVRRSAENENDTEIFIPYTTLKGIFSKSDKIDMMAFTFHGLDTEEENEAFEKEYKRALNTVHGAAPDDERAIRGFMDETGYRFGRFDFIRKDGELWFLELNPNGQWAWLDEKNEHGLVTLVANAIKAEDRAHGAHPFRQGLPQRSRAALP